MRPFAFSLSFSRALQLCSPYYFDALARLSHFFPFLFVQNKRLWTHHSNASPLRSHTHSTRLLPLLAPTPMSSYITAAAKCNPSLLTSADYNAAAATRSFLLDPNAAVLLDSLGANAERQTRRQQKKRLNRSLQSRPQLSDGGEGSTLAAISDTNNTTTNNNSSNDAEAKAEAEQRLRHAQRHIKRPYCVFRTPIALRELSTYEQLSIRHRVALRAADGVGTAGAEEAERLRKAAAHRVNAYEPIRGVAFARTTTALRIDDPRFLGSSTNAASSEEGGFLSLGQSTSSVSTSDAASTRGPLRLTPLTVLPLDSSTTSNGGRQLGTTTSLLSSPSSSAVRSESASGLGTASQKQKSQRSQSQQQPTANDAVLRQLRLRLRDEPSAALARSHQQAAARLAGGDTLYGPSVPTGVASAAATAAASVDGAPIAEEAEGGVASSASVSAASATVAAAVAGQYTSYLAQSAFAPPFSLSPAAASAPFGGRADSSAAATANIVLLPNATAAVVPHGSSVSTVRPSVSLKITGGGRRSSEDALGYGGMLHDTSSSRHTTNSANATNALATLSGTSSQRLTTANNMSGGRIVFVTAADVEAAAARRRERIARLDSLHDAYRGAILRECEPSKAAPRPFRTLPEPM